MVACFKPQKAPLDFIRLAFLINQALPAVKFILAGDGVLRGDIQLLINKLNLRDIVILTGWRRDIHNILSALDIFVLTSLWEGLPITVLEAIVSSVPVLGTNTGGIAEVIIDGKTGFLSAPGDIQEMFKKLSVLLKDSEFRKQIAGQARNNFNEDFTLAKMVKNTRDLYCACFPRDKA